MHEGNDKISFISLIVNDLSKAGESTVKIIHILSLSLLYSRTLVSQIFSHFVRLNHHFNCEDRIHTEKLVHHAEDSGTEIGDYELSLHRRSWGNLI